MRKLLLALLMLALVVPACFADGNKFSVTGFRIDENEQMSYKSLTELATTNDTVTATETGKVFIVTPPSQTTFILPTAASGLVFTFSAADGNAGGTKKLVLDPQSSDKFVGCVNSPSTSTFAAGDSLISPGATGDTVTVVGATTKWYCTSRIGTWADNN